MGYDPQRRRPRPRVSNEELAPVDAILDEVADVPPAADAPERPVAEGSEPSVVEFPAPQWNPEPVAELYEPPLDVPVVRMVPAAPIEPAVPTPARAANWRVAAVVVAVLGVVLVVWRWRRHSR